MRIWEMRELARLPHPVVLRRRRRSEQMVLHDHTAPWVCGEQGCVICDHKPSYSEYMGARFG